MKFSRNYDLKSKELQDYLVTLLKEKYDKQFNKETNHKISNISFHMIK